MRLAAHIVGLASFTLVACGGGKSSAPPPASPEPIAEPAPAPEPEGPVVGPPEVAWKDLTVEQKKAFMKAKVVPTMQPLFAGFEPEEFGQKFDCTSCHGARALEGKFEMPNPDLPKLPSTKEGFAKLAADEPKALEFMATQVKPTMAKLLGLPEFNPAEPDKGGFGCHACHVMQ